ncbi:gamma-glutamyltransferase, partial [Magnaporthiopsis poae ATCC 64411]
MARMLSRLTDYLIGDWYRGRHGCVIALAATGPRPIRASHCPLSILLRFPESSPWVGIPRNSGPAHSENPTLTNRIIASRKRQLLLPLLAASHSWHHASAFPTYSYQEPIARTQHSSGSKGAVASESAICSQIGIDLMRRGGNAADAMVGTNLCIGVVSMYHSGIGGGGFMLVRGADGSHEVIDYRETAPAAASEDMYRDNVAGSIYGGLSVGIPGELRGLEYLHNKYGAIVNPAVKVARDGFPVTEDLVRYMAESLKKEGRPNFLVDDPAWAEDFAPNGTLVKLGDTITRKRYADTLDKIGRYGADVFYQGEIAQSMIDLIRATNGTMTLADLASYKITTPPAVSVEYRGYRVWSTPSPTSGAVCLSILKTMEQYPRAALLADANLTTH